MEILYHDFIIFFKSSLPYRTHFPKISQFFFFCFISNSNKNTKIDLSHDLPFQENAALLQLLGGRNWRPREKFRPGQSRPTARQRQFRELRDHRRSGAVIREAVRLQGELLRLQPRHASEPGIVQLIRRFKSRREWYWLRD